MKTCSAGKLFWVWGSISPIPLRCFYFKNRKKKPYLKHWKKQYFIKFSVSGCDQAKTWCWHPVQGLGGLEYDQSAPGRWLHLPILGAVWRRNGGWVFHGLCKRWRLDTQSQGQFILFIRGVGASWAGWAILVFFWRWNGGWVYHGLCKRWRLDTQSQGQ